MILTGLNDGSFSHKLTNDTVFDDIDFTPTSSWMRCKCGSRGLDKSLWIKSKYSSLIIEK